jgi:carboxyl-terminal processing protease
MNPRNIFPYVWLHFLLILILLPGIAASQVGKNQAEKLQRALQIIEFAYVEAVDDNSLVEHAIRGMLKELDPHSVYLSADELRRANEPLLGSFEGIGIQFNIINDSITVVSPIPGGPSEKVGIMPGDKIIRIDGESSAGSHVTNQMVMEKLRGDRGSLVTVGIVRRGTADILDFTITRDRIPINSLDVAFMATPEIGYIKLNRFARTTMREFREAVEQLNQEGMQHMILDLSFNSGGYLDVAIDLSDQFLDRDQLIVYTEGHAAPTQQFNSTFRGIFKQGKLVVIINEGSASASEIVAGAVQDWDRGLLVGRRSFGKGLVQRPFDLPDGSAIRLTTARYHTPTGRNIQKPYDEGTDKYFKDLSERLENGEMIDPDKISFPDSLKYYTKLNKRVVYGGGGITPDFFIPLDTTRVSTHHSRLIRRGVLNAFAIEHTNENREELSRRFPDLTTYMHGFTVEEQLLKQLYDYAEKQGIRREEEDLEMQDDYLKNQLKGLIARSLFDFGAYLQISLQEDMSFRRAIEIIENDTFDKLNIRYR